jgi:hypothetical protein
MGFYEVISYQKYDIWGKLWTLVLYQISQTIFRKDDVIDPFKKEDLSSESGRESGLPSFDDSAR